jgi:DNA polymerase I-like protein with 3'-5' exonuclease and polymerase domains
MSEVPEERVDEAETILEYVMNDVVTNFKVPFVSEGKCGYTWADTVVI